MPVFRTLPTRFNKHYRKPSRFELMRLEDRWVPSTGCDTQSIAVGFLTGNPADPVISRAVPVEAGQTVEQAIALWGAKSGVAYAEPNYIVSNSATPSDTLFSNQYAQIKTSATSAWEITTGSAKTVAAVIDTGVDYTHPDLYKNIWINQAEIPTSIRANLTDVDGDGKITFWDLNNPTNIGTGKALDLNANGYIDGGDLIQPTAQGGWDDGVDQGGDGYIDDIIGWNFISNTNDPMDLTAEGGGHGTHVSGTIGAMGNNGVGVAGMAWQVEIMPLRFIGATGGSSTAAAAAIRFSATNGAVVSNNSWGGGGYTQTLYDAINYARTKGEIFVAAAGNSSANNDTTAFYPSNYNLDNIVSVAATDQNDLLASFSNYGQTTVDLAAPGVGIVSTYPGKQYVSMSGTSMATPQVTGSLVLLLSKEPNLTYSQAVARTLNSVDKLSNLTATTVSGGRLNAYKMLTSTSADTTGASVTTLTPNATGTNPVTSVRLTFSEAIDAATFTTSDVAITGPNGAVIAATGITPLGTAGTQFDVDFASQSTIGSYSVKVGPDVRDLAGNLMDQNRNGANGEAADQYTGTFAIAAPTSTTTFANTTSVAIPDLKTVSSKITINQDLTISDLNVKVNIAHTYDSDLTITLIGPDGTSVNLFNRRGGSGDNLTNTYFNDEATVMIRNGAAPFAGSFKPEAVLSAFDGKNTRGTWELRITDNAKTDIGTLKNWALDVTTGNPGTLSTTGGIDMRFVESISVPTAITSPAQPTTPSVSPPSSVAASIAPLWVLFADGVVGDPFAGSLDPFARRMGLSRR